MLGNILFSLTIILLGLTTGYVVQILEKRKKIRLPMPMKEFRKILQKVGIFFFMSVSFIGALWVVDLGDVRLFSLPLLGIAVLFTGGVLGAASAGMMGLPRRKAGSLFVCCMFSNLGSIGGLICYVFLGEVGFAMMALYKLFEQVLYFCVGFPIARYYSTDGGASEGILSTLKKVFADIFVLVAFFSIITGLLLNLSGISRPAFYITINSFFIPMGTFVLLSSIGMAMTFGHVRYYIRECLTVLGIKFILLPIMVFTAGILLGYGQIEDGIPLKVSLVLSAMPVGFLALVPPTLYDLDLDLANSCWLVTTLGLVLILPVLVFLINFI